jgi:hypothetical protein
MSKPTEVVKTTSAGATIQNVWICEDSIYFWSQKRISSAAWLPMLLLNFLHTYPFTQIKIGANIGPSLNISLSPNTLANLSQFFSILSNLKCFSSAFSSFRNHLSNAKPKERPKKISKEKKKIQIAKCVFFHYFSFCPSYFLSA